MEPRTVVRSLSPNGNLEALVEQDDRCAYLYLREVDEPSFELGLGLRSCWVRNLMPAPPSLRVTELRQGLAPMLPASSCAHPQGAPPLSADAVRLVWLEEGDAVALMEGESVLAIMPCWSGRRGFQGYARDCTEESPLAWPLAPDSVLRERVRAAEEYWRSWDGGDPWATVREAGLKAIAATFGEPTNYYAIDGGEWPPQGMARCASGDAIVLVTCGMQLRPQPTVELHAEDPRPIRRIELGLAIERRLFELAPTAVMGWLSGQTTYPWHRLSWFGHQHTLPCGAIPPGPSRRVFSAMIFLRDPLGAPRVPFPPFRDDPVNVLWLVPITAQERAVAARDGGEALARLLSAKGHGFVHRDRAPVV